MKMEILKQAQKETDSSLPQDAPRRVHDDYSVLCDKELWLLFRSGDEGAFVAIYQQYVDVLYNYGLQFTSDKEGLKDCIQDFFIYIRAKRGALGDTDAIKPYLLRSLRRRLFNHLKNLRKERASQERYIHEVPFQFELSHETLLIERQFSDSQLSSLNRALKSLSSKEREVIYLFFFEALSYREIAKIQGFAHVSSARRLIYNTLKHLKTMLKVYVILWLAGVDSKGFHFF